VFYSSPLTLVLLGVAVLSFAMPALKFMRGRLTRRLA
jgi:putative tricarboxylic transport membrane protein